jgi:hypothetical protein
LQAAAIVGQTRTKVNKSCSIITNPDYVLLIDR